MDELRRHKDRALGPVAVRAVLGLELNLLCLELPGELGGEELAVRVERNRLSAAQGREQCLVQYGRPEETREAAPAGVVRTRAVSHVGEWPPS